MKASYQVVIIGAGVAGASLAYRLAQLGVGDILVVEREARPGHHASGRSASAFLSFSRDPFERRAVVTAGAFFRAPPPGFEPLLDPTGVLLLFDEPDWAWARAAARGLEELGAVAAVLAPGEAARHAPLPLAGGVAGAIHLPQDGRLNVPALLRGYLDGARSGGAEIVYDTAVTGVRVANRTCVGVETGRGGVSARWVVNAAGAWAGHLGRLAGATAVELEPRRRTVITFDGPTGRDVTGWPLVSYESRRIYFAPERAPHASATANRLLACPMDEDPMHPCDAAPDPAVIARARARLAQVAPLLAPARLRSARAGLRMFARDGRLVLGEDPALAGFFWLAGQGGWGIESSPVISQIAAELLVRGTTEWPEAAALSPRRFAR